MPRKVARFRKLLVATAALSGMVVIGIIDFLSGIEYRVFPLYFLPLSLAAWHLGQTAALAGAILAAVVWLLSNYLAGRELAPTVWVFNFLMQGVAFVVVGSLIARVRDESEHVRQLSRTDPLTSLLNGRAFYEEAGRILVRARRYRSPVAFAYVDVDNFKAVNDRLGHSAGDQVLRRIAAVLTQGIRASDLSARLGGDEFVLLLDETMPDGASLTFERLRALVTESFKDAPIPVTISIGAVAFLSPPAEIDDLVRHADALMYTAKASGKDRVRFELVDGSAAYEPAASSAAGR